ncbi:hypothetical protein N8I77_000084 [Diaporthe amygdali]|uniref:Uncharacterized protein n=1 Tax=Phomopsis amygdali TaxID=1214568 RepID=A0AAD9W6S3_PHOAM|nr:hypothetical protein N8I77_000084 [Diaporthe amygdali]
MSEEDARNWSLFLRQRRLKDQLRRLQNDYKDCYCPVGCRGTQYTHLPADLGPMAPEHQDLHGPHVRVSDPLPMTKYRNEFRTEEGLVVLAEARGMSDILLHRERTRATLRMSLQVYSHPQYARTGLRGYYAEMFLTRPGQQEIFMGIIHSWYIDRSTPRETWESVILYLHMDDDNSRPDMPDINDYFRSLYGDNNHNRDNNGALLPLAAVRRHHGARWARLNDDTDFVYISVIWIDQQASGNRIIDQAFELFYRLMVGGTLPAPYNLNRPLTLLLRPGLLQGDFIGVWRDREGGASPDEERTTNVISRVYERNGYMHLFDPGRYDILLMGRRVDARDHPAAPDDMATYPPAPPDSDLNTPSPRRQARGKPLNRLGLKPMGNIGKPLGPLQKQMEQFQSLQEGQQEDQQEDQPEDQRESH